MKNNIFDFVKLETLLSRLSFLRDAFIIQRGKKGQSQFQRIACLTFPYLRYGIRSLSLAVSHRDYKFLEIHSGY